MIPESKVLGDVSKAKSERDKGEKVQGESWDSTPPKQTRGKTFTDDQGIE